MDTTAQEITFDSEGVCNFCIQAEKAIEDIKDDVLPDIKGKDYDCLVGLSGGVDSSTVLLKAIELGLRPLCFSVDNGWQDPKAQENIMRLVEGLKVPYYRYNIDLTKFRELQGAFIKAGLKNLEIPTDHILMATTYEMASKYGIKWVLSGGNVATESIMPASWGHNARDLTHIKDVYKKMTGKKLTGLPVCGLMKWNWYRWIKGVKILYLLDHFEYNRAESIALLQEKYGYESYGEKHEESKFTKWFQNFYLYEKFGIDKRKAHFSSMIVSGQMTRDEALRELENKPEYEPMDFNIDYPIHEHGDFKMDKWYGRISKIVKWLS